MSVLVFLSPTTVSSSWFSLVYIGGAIVLILICAIIVSRIDE